MKSIKPIKLSVLLVLILTGCSFRNAEPRYQYDELPSHYTEESYYHESSEVSEETEEENENEMDTDDVKNMFDFSAIVDEYKNIVSATADIFDQMEHLDTYEGYVYTPSKKDILMIARRISELGYTVKSNEMNMMNPEQVTEFLKAVDSGESADLAIYRVNYSIMRETFHTEGGQVYNTSVELKWDTEGRPFVPPVSYGKRLDLFYLTPKGYLMYGIDKQSTLKVGYKYGLRVTPLGDENYEMLKYLQPLYSYKGHNVMVDNWDLKSLETINYNDVFHILYLYEYGEAADVRYHELYEPGNLQTKAIPGNVFEKVIQKYFPVSTDRLREYAAYDPAKHTYAFEPDMMPDDVPEWEITDIIKNTDGSITLIIDAVFLKHAEDRVATNYLTIMPKDDGSFQYVSNVFEKNPDSLITMHDYRPRIKKEA